MNIKNTLNVRIIELLNNRNYIFTKILVILVIMLFFNYIEIYCMQENTEDLKERIKELEEEIERLREENYLLEIENNKFFEENLTLKVDSEYKTVERILSREEELGTREIGSTTNSRSSYKIDKK